MKYKIKEIIGTFGVVMFLLGILAMIGVAVWGLVEMILSGHLILGCFGLATIIAVTGAVVVGISG